MNIHRIILALSLLTACSAIAGTARVTDREARPTDAAIERIYRAAVEDQDPAAMYALGNMFDAGVGVAQNHEEAFKWYSRAAGRGNGEAMNSLGIAYAQGEGVPQSYDLSFQWFLKAVHHGSVNAMSNIAIAYFRGAGRPVDYSEAARWFERAALRGEIALALFEHSASLGYPQAMENLGVLYAKGEGVKQDVLVAYAWMEAALEAGLQGEAREAVTQEMGALAARLGAKELAQARKLVAAISAEVVHHHPSQEAQPDSVPPKPDYL